MDFLLNKLSRFLLVLSLVFCMINLKSISDAYTFEQFEQFLNAVYDNNITSSAYNHNNASVVLQKWQTIKNTLTNNNVDLTQYDSFAIYGNGTNINLYDHYEVFLFQKNTWIQYGLSQNYGSNGFFDIKGQGIKVNTNGVLSNQSSNSWRNNARCGIFNKESSNMGTAVTQYRWDPNDHPLVPPFYFTPYGISMSGDYYLQKFTYSGPNLISLGELGNNTYYQIDIRLKHSTGLVTLGTISMVSGEGSIDDRGAIYLSGNRVNVKTDYLRYTRPYYLEFQVYSDRDTFELYGYTYKFFPYDAIIENGQITYSGDLTGYDLQDLAINIPGLIVGNLPSGDDAGSGILGGIGQLLLPGDDPLSNWVNNYLIWSDSHLGMLWTPFEFALSFLNRLLNIDYTHKVMELGPYTLPLSNNITFIPKITFDFDSYINQNSPFYTIYNYYLVIMDGFVVFGLIKLIQHEFSKIVGDHE